jgi:hypothetical protein
MWVRFIVGYRGRLSAEQWYPAGAVADLPDGAALVAEGRAVPVEDAPVPTQPKRKDTTGRKGRAP